MMESITFGKMGGLVPVVVQDAADKTVLMVGFMNDEALRRTMEERQVIFWSRSKQRLWKKGETSGNVLDLVSVETDCDNDSLLVTVRPRGPVCHTGDRSCFHGARVVDNRDVLEKLAEVIRDRKKELPEKSYTTELFRKGVPFIGQKVGEEAVELAIAAQYPDRKRCIEEMADLIYHSFVLLEEKGIGISEVKEELAHRMTEKSK